MTDKKMYAAPSLTVCELLNEDVLTQSVGAKYMGDEWNVMDDNN